MDIYFTVEYWVVRIEWHITELHVEYKYKLIVFRYISFHWWECLPKRSSDLIVSHQFIPAYTCYYNTDPWVQKIHWRRKRQPTPVLLPGKSHDRGSWWATVLGVARSQTWFRNYTTTITIGMKTGIIQGISSWFKIKLCILGQKLGFQITQISGHINFLTVFCLFHMHSLCWSLLL